MLLVIKELLLSPFYFRYYSSFIIVWRFLDLAADKYIIWDLWLSLLLLSIFWSVSRALCFIMFDSQMRVKSLWKRFTCPSHLEHIHVITCNWQNPNDYGIISSIIKIRYYVSISWVFFEFQTWHFWSTLMHHDEENRYLIF